MNGIPAHGVIEEFERAKCEIGKDPATVPVWQPIIAKYSPTLIGECEKAIAWSNEMTSSWLLNGMLKGQSEEAAQRIVNELGDHALTKSHARHLSAEDCRNMGLTVEALEEDDCLQDAVLSLHHSCIHTLGSTNAFKIIENHNGVAFINSAQKVIVQQ